MPTRKRLISRISRPAVAMLRRPQCGLSRQTGIPAGGGARRKRVNRRKWLIRDDHGQVGTGTAT
jgi:hypothetical protein